MTWDNSFLMGLQNVCSGGGGLVPVGMFQHFLPIFWAFSSPKTAGVSEAQSPRVLDWEVRFKARTEVMSTRRSHRHGFHTELAQNPSGFDCIAIVQWTGVRASEGRATPSAFAFAARQRDWFALVNSYVVATLDAFFTLFCGIAKTRCGTATRSVWPGLDNARIVASTDFLSFYLLQKREEEKGTKGIRLWNLLPADIWDSNAKSETKLCGQNNIFPKAGEIKNWISSCNWPLDIGQKWKVWSAFHAGVKHFNTNGRIKM